RGPRASRRPAHRDPVDHHGPGAAGPGDAHRDVAAPGHARERRPAAAPRRTRARSGRGPLAGAESGPGPPPEPDRLVHHALSLLGNDSADGDVGIGASAAGTNAASTDTAGTNLLGVPWSGRRVAVSAGGTREPLDPVRFLGNRSSGRQG